MYRFDDFIGIPLQPLHDNLDAYTYEVFEKDPVKYKKYQQAMERALIDMVAESDILTQTVSLQHQQKQITWKWKWKLMAVVVAEQ